LPPFPLTPLAIGQSGIRAKWGRFSFILRSSNVILV
jgi:hypothetical protein